MKIFYKSYLIILFLFHIFLLFKLPLNNNMTGLVHEYPLLISCWALLSSGYILYLLYPFSLTVFTKSHTITYASFIMLNCFLTLILPYDLVQYPLLSSLHLAFAFSFFFFISVYFLALLFHFYFIKPSYFKIIFNIYLFLGTLSIIIFFNALSITTLFEINYTLNLILCSTLLHYYFEKKN